MCRAVVFFRYLRLRCDIGRVGPYFDDDPFDQTMKTLTTLSLILLLAASYTAKAEDEKAAKRQARRKAAEAAQKPSEIAVPA